jgi:uncharacterized SAM-binding protein YcdF (DUF218 family)
MAVWSGTWFFAVWYAIGAMLLGAAWAVHSGWWEQAPLAFRRATEAVCLAVLVAMLVFGGMAASGFGERAEDDLDYIVVLGAQVHEDRPSAVLQYRLDAAYDYLVGNPRTVCIVSGGQGPNEPRAEASVMGDYLEARGIEPSRIVRETAATTTAQNIENSMKIIGSDTARVGIVTNDFHMFRSLKLARGKGLANACGIVAPSNPWFLPNNLLREALAIAKGLLLGS